MDSVASNFQDIWGERSGCDCASKENDFARPFLMGGT